MLTSGQTEYQLKYVPESVDIGEALQSSSDGGEDGEDNDDDSVQLLARVQMPQATEEMAAKSIQGEIAWLLYAGLALRFDYFILAARIWEDKFCGTHLG